MHIRTYPFVTLDGYVSHPGRPAQFSCSCRGFPGAGGFPFDTWTPLRGMWCPSFRCPPKRVNSTLGLTPCLLVHEPHPFVRNRRGRRADRRLVVTRGDPA
jgi:hypothetical protein